MNERERVKLKFCGEGQTRVRGSEQWIDSTLNNSITSFTMKMISIVTMACLLLAMAVTTPIVVDGGKKSIVGCQEVIILM